MEMHYSGTAYMGKVVTGAFVILAKVYGIGMSIQWKRGTSCKYESVSQDCVGHPINTIICP